MQPDSLIPDPSNPQAWNRYSYVVNRPINLNDPSGHCPWCIAVGVGAVVGAAIGYGTQVYNNYQNGNANPWTSNIDADPIVNGAFIGAGAVLVVGLIATAPIFAAPTVAAGAACADGDCTNEVTAAEEAISKQTTAIAPYTSNNAIVPYYPPNNGAAGEEVLKMASKGQLLSQIGPPSSPYSAPPGILRGMLSLPYGKEKMAENLYQVAKPFTYYESKVAPWFGKIGGGIQYRATTSLQWLPDNNYIREHQ